MNGRSPVAPEVAPSSFRACTDESRRNRRASFLQALKGLGHFPLRLLVTDELSRYVATLRTITHSVTHDTERYSNNREKISHQPTRQREWQMGRFKSPAQTQRFFSVHGLDLNLIPIARHRMNTGHHRLLRARFLETWNAVAAAYTTDHNPGFPVGRRRHYDGVAHGAKPGRRHRSTELFESPSQIAQHQTGA